MFMFRGPFWNILYSVNIDIILIIIYYDLTFSRK